MKECLSYDDVLLVPQYSDIVSRDDVDISSRLGGMSLSLPLIASPMDSISEHRMGASMSNNGGTSVVHRYNTIEQQVHQVNIARNLSNNPDPVIGAAIGITGDYLDRAIALQGSTRQLCMSRCGTRSSHSNERSAAARLERSLIPIYI